MTDADQPAISAVVPVYNEEGNVAPLYRELREVLDRLGEPYEIVFVNDGSTDRTRAQLATVQGADPRLRVVDLDGNFGEAAALSAGFHAARGQIIVTLDGDGQNDPADIPRLIEALRTRDLRAVSGLRQNRQEGFWLRVLPSRLANALIARVTGVPVHDCGCGLKAYRRAAIPRMHIPRGLHRFLPALFGVTAREVAEIPTHDRRRAYGQSHYGITRTFAVLRDLLALPFIIRGPRRAEITFALAAAGSAALGALFLSTSRLATAACDVIAVLCGLIWWNARRFNRAQLTGVYRVREGDV